MSSSKKTILFASVASIILLIITYLITVNIETGAISVDSPWISNNFFFAFFGGAFASMCVVLICEVQKFCSAKTSTEKYLFFQASFLYMQLYKMQQNIIDMENHPGEEIVKNFFDEPLSQIHNTANSILGTDYTRFSKGNTFLVQHQAFLLNLQKQLPIVLSGKSALEVAILEIKILRSDQEIKELERVRAELNIEMMRQVQSEQRKYSPITAKDHPVSDVLKVHKQHVEKAMEFVDSYLISLDKENRGSFEWAEQKEAQKKSFVHLFDAWSLEKYLKQE